MKKNANSYIIVVAIKATMVKVRFFATLRELAGHKDVFVEAEDISVLLEKLEKHNKKLCNEIAENGVPKPLVKILVNGRNIEFLNKTKTKLAKSDVISIFPPVAGG
ncbi:MAG: ubiquitin-like small modifier protein 1 [Candidatus Methanofastidiosia archaeon]